VAGSSLPKRGPGAAARDGSGAAASASGCAGGRSLPQAETSAAPASSANADWTAGGRAAASEANGKARITCGSCRACGGDARPAPRAERHTAAEDGTQPWSRRWLCVPGSPRNGTAKAGRAWRATSCCADGHRGPAATHRRPGDGRGTRAAAASGFAADATPSGGAPPCSRIASRRIHAGRPARKQWSVLYLPRSRRVEEPHLPDNQP